MPMQIARRMLNMEINEERSVILRKSKAPGISPGQHIKHKNISVNQSTRTTSPLG